VKNWCSLAFRDFLENSMKCSYIDPETGNKCENTKSGHARGHQNSDASLLEVGSFVDGPWSIFQFIEAVESKVTTFLHEINSLEGDFETRWRFAITSHRNTLQSANDLSFWRETNLASIFFDLVEKTDDLDLYEIIALYRRLKGRIEILGHVNTCFACLFGRPEYYLPCGNLLCEDCFVDFGERNETYPDIITHERCFLCSYGGSNSLWPVKLRVRPQISGTRILSLDGGGVRGIIELEILRRIEHSIGLGLPIWYFFDLIVGTSAGEIL
jgi:hypothetical protein